VQSLSMSISFCPLRAVAEDGEPGEQTPKAYCGDGGAARRRHESARA
jgi:hypothetical protein